MNLWFIITMPSADSCGSSGLHLESQTVRLSSLGGCLDCYDVNVSSFNSTFLFLSPPAFGVWVFEVLSFFQFLSVAQNKLKSLSMASQPRLQVCAFKFTLPMCCPFLKINLLSFIMNSCRCWLLAKTRYLLCRTFQFYRL